MLRQINRKSSYTTVYYNTLLYIVYQNMLQNSIVLYSTLPYIAPYIILCESIAYYIIDCYSIP